MAAAIKALGFDYVFDTSWSADLTILEEGTELVKRLTTKGSVLPQFTSCCPAWVKYCEEFYPELLPNLSSAKSPQQMIGAAIKEYLPGIIGKTREDIYNVSIMPCTAKKAEILRPDNFTNGRQDTDIVLTTQEIIRMIKQVGITFEELESEAPDMPFGMASGGASIFGVTGGVTEAVLRHVAKEQNHTTIEAIKYSGIRGTDNFKEATVNIGDKEVKIAVVYGLHTAGKLIEKIKSGEANYDFVEVMACRRGCILGGGQPIPMGPRTRSSRTEGLYQVDQLSSIRFTDENPMLNQIWDTVIKGDEHKLLHRAGHTEHNA